MSLINKYTLTALVSILLTAGCNTSTTHKVEPFKISDIQISDGPFYKRQQADIHYMLEMDVDRLLAPFLKDAGIKPLKDNYGNWENTGLDGHIGGHYLSALALMYAATQNQELLQRSQYMVDWLDRCQQKNGNGYVGGIPDGQNLWKEIGNGKIDAGAFSLNGKWVPLYNIHKLFNGLIDAWQLTGNEKAKEVLLKLSQWFYSEINPLSDEQIQYILTSEHGGINEVFVDIAAISGDQKYLDFAKRLSHRLLLDTLIVGKEHLTGMHANTQIPKVIGYKRYADATQNADWDRAAAFFWQAVIQKWTVSIGGNSVREHFHPANDFSSMIESEQGPETCNTYNMLKLTRLLYLSDPNERYMAFYEKALFNHILSSIHPDKGGFVYFTPMRPDHYRVYSQPHQCFWCCVGTGLENPGKYGEMIYAHRNNHLYVNLFIASTLNWHQKEVVINQSTSFPDKPATTLTIETKNATRFTLHLRIPDWMKKEGIVVHINHQEQKISEINDNYLAIKRKWKNGDVISLSFAMKTIVERMPDQSDWVSFSYGPIVLAAATDTNNLTGLWADDSRMGHVASGEFYPIDQVPAIVTRCEPDNMAGLLKPADDGKLIFELNDLQNTHPDKPIRLVPFYSIHESRYMIYWPFFTPEKYSARKAEIALHEQQAIELKSKTLDQINPGEQQPESDHFIKMENSNSGVHKNCHWRDAAGWFCYKLKNTKSEPCILRITYFGLDNGRQFTIFINGEPIATQQLDGKQGDLFFDMDYPIPAKWISPVMEVKFEAKPGSIAGGVYGIRLLRK